MATAAWRDGRDKPRNVRRWASTVRWRLEGELMRLLKGRGDARVEALFETDGAGVSVLCLFRGFSPDEIEALPDDLPKPADRAAMARKVYRSRGISEDSLT